MTSTTKILIAVILFSTNFLCVQSLIYETMQTLGSSNLKSTKTTKQSSVPWKHLFLSSHTFKHGGMDGDASGIKLAFKKLEKTVLPPAKLNKLRENLLVHPFKTWKLKHKFSSMKDIRIHEDKLYDVIENPMNERLKDKLYKVLKGQDVYLDIFGGSNSLGAGLHIDEGDRNGRYSKVILHWWSKTITPVTGSHLKVRQNAIGAISSCFFQFCFGSYIHKNPDLVIIELSINDVGKVPSNVNQSLPLEQFTRQVLTYSTEPAVVYVNLFDARFCAGNCDNLEDYGQDVLTSTYNITTLKWRKAVCPPNNAFNPCDFAASDQMHINQLAHGHISLMVINLFRKILLEHTSNVIGNPRVLLENRQTCVSHVKTSTFSSRDDIFTRVGKGKIFSSRYQRSGKTTLPRPVFLTQMTKIIAEPLCCTNYVPQTRHAKHLRNNLNVVIIQTKGFHVEDSKIGRKCIKPPCQYDKYTNWTGEDVDARMTISFIIPNNSFSQCPMKSQSCKRARSVGVAFRTCVRCGGADMWVDKDYENKQFVPMKFGYGLTRIVMLAFHVQPGSHSINIKITKKGTISINAVIVGPSDGPY